MRFGSSAFRCTDTISHEEPYEGGARFSERNQPRARKQRRGRMRAHRTPS